MIVANERESALECNICGELEGVSPKAFENAENLERLKKRVAQDHSECEQWAGNPRKAQIERGYRNRMRAELQRVG